jgi:hypothetical protein
MSCSAFSQSDTIKLSESTARKIAQDLVRLDGANELIRLLESNQATYLQLITLKDSIIQAQVVSIGKYNQIISNKDLMYRSLTVQYEELIKKNKTNVRVSRFKTVCVVALAGLLLYSTL